MAKRKKTHPETGEEISDETDPIEETAAANAEEMEKKQSEEAEQAEGMKEQQEEASKEAAQHADDLRQHAAKTASTRPKEIFTVKGETISTMPTDLEDFEGEYKNADDGEIYGLKMMVGDPHGRPYHLKNEEHYWSGTPEEFKAKFEKQ